MRTMPCLALAATMAAVQARRTDYRETTPKDDPTTTGVHALDRMSFGSRFEMDLGFGALVLQREGRRSGFSFTLPILVRPSDHFGIEFRPAWSDLGASTIQDYDIAISSGWRHVSARAGYRRVHAEFARLDRPGGRDLRQAVIPAATARPARSGFRLTSRI